MKTIIYYFSGTGNNLAIAKQLQKELGNTAILPFSALEENKHIPEEYDWIGFSVPTYYSHIPPYVGTCMDGLQFTSHHKIFVIAGCGGNSGLTIQDMRHYIHNSHKEVNLEYMVMLPGNYILSYNAFPGWYQRFFTKHSYGKIQKIAQDIKQNRKRKPARIGIFYTEKNEPAFQKVIASFSDTGKQYKVAASCTGCGACVRLCPVGNITIENGHPVFGDHCNQCMACIQWCDQHAIDFEQKAQSRTRYHHADIKRQDLFQR